MRAPTTPTDAATKPGRPGRPGRIGDCPVRVSLEDITAFPEFQTTAHWIDSIRLVLVKTGRMRLLINERGVLARARDFILIPPGQIHSFAALENEDCRYVDILFGSDVFTNSASVVEECIMPVIRSGGPDHHHIADNGRLNALVDLIHDLSGQGTAAGRLHIIGLIHCLFAELRALLPQEDVRPADDRDMMLALLRRMMRYIYKHFNEKISIDDIAASARISRSRCFALFRKYAQQSPINFVNEYRLTMAQHLLRNSRDSIAEVAFSCGFAHQSYFTELFVRKFGCTPMRYRKGVGEDSG